MVEQLHYALVHEQYEIAEELLQYPERGKIINIPNSATESILRLIVRFPSEEKALMLIFYLRSYRKHQPYRWLVNLGS